MGQINYPRVGKDPEEGHYVVIRIGKTPISIDDQYLRIKDFGKGGLYPRTISMGHRNGKFVRLIQFDYIANPME